MSQDQPGTPPVGAMWDGQQWVIPPPAAPAKRKSGCFAWGCLIVLVTGIVLFLGGAFLVSRNGPPEGTCPTTSATSVADAFVQGVNKGLAGDCE